MSGGTHRVEALSRQEHEAREIAERISEGQDLVVMPLFERPMAWHCVPLLGPPVAVGLDDGGVDHGVPHVGIVLDGFKLPHPNPPSQSRKRVHTLRPGSPGSPRQSDPFENRSLRPYSIGSPHYITFVSRWG